MAKKKNAMALFEVISQEKGKKRAMEVQLPDWVKNPTEPAEQTQGQPEESSGDEPVAAAVPPQASGPVSPPSAEPAMYASAAAYEPMISTAGGRLRLSLNYASCTLVLLSVVMIAILAFALGRASAPSVAAAPVETPTSSEPGESAAQTAGAAAAAPGHRVSAEPAGPARVVGKNYLVIQHTGGKAEAHLDAARRVARYCNEWNFPADVAEDEQGYLVWSLEGFDSTLSPQALEYAQRIQDLGKRYKAETGGAYDFSQSDEVGRLRPRFAPYEAP